MSERDRVLLGFALTQHCNLRCAHCIRDDVATVRSLDAALVLRVTDEARALFGEVTASFTGGEPTLHPEWDRIVCALAARGVPYRFVSNGWHLRRLMPSIDRAPPAYVRLSLSGATAEVHDAERGRDSFRRVLMAVALLTSRRIPTALSIVIDRRDRHQIADAAALAEELGCPRLHYILPQPVPQSVARDTDLPPDEWPAVRDEILALAARPGRRTVLQLDYGSPALPGAEEPLCDTMGLQRVYVDAHGRVSLCCQLSEYGFNDEDVVADLTRDSLASVWSGYRARLDDLRARAARTATDGPLGALPCMRCAHRLGKLRWLAVSAPGPWQAVAAR